MMTLNLIDGTNIFYICWSVYRHKLEEAGLEISEESYGEMINIFFMKIKQYYNADTVVIAFEGKDSRKWRKDIYPEYKGTRPTSEEDPALIHIKPLMNRIIELLKLTPAYIMKVDNCEADDVIFTLANSAWTKHKDNIKITIISSDEDMTQIPIRLDTNYVKVFHPCMKKYRECNPLIVIQKVFSGDVSDNIKFKNGIGNKTALKLAEGDNKLFNRFITSFDDCKRLMSIAEIVDSRYFPIKYRQSIIDEIRSQKIDFNIETLNELIDELKKADATYCTGFIERILRPLASIEYKYKINKNWADASRFILPTNVYELIKDEYLKEKTKKFTDNLEVLKETLERKSLI